MASSIWMKWWLVVSRIFIVHHECAPQGQTITKEYNRDVLHHLRDAVRHKRLELLSTGNWHLHHNNAPAHSSHLIQSFFLAKNETPVVPQAPYSLDMTPCDFWLFPSKGWILFEEWKLDETTKHYITQMLLVINWRGKKIYAFIWRLKVASCKHASLKSTRFSKKRVGYFLTDLVLLLHWSRGQRVY